MQLDFTCFGKVLIAVRTEVTRERVQLVYKKSSLIGQLTLGAWGHLFFSFWVLEKFDVF